MNINGKDGISNQIWPFCISIGFFLFGIILKSVVLLAQLITMIWNYSRDRVELLTSFEVVLIWVIQLVVLISFYFVSFGLWRAMGGQCERLCVSDDNNNNNNNNDDDDDDK